jgi:hypothetical protein
MKLNGVEREALLGSLAEMKNFLSEAFGALTAAEAATPGTDGSFSPIEQVWHLADLEREGFGRIRSSARCQPGDAPVPVCRSLVSQWHARRRWKSVSV